MTKPSRIDRLIRPEIRSLKAYHVPDAAGLIKLDAMENPYAWPGELRERWLASLNDVALNRYPDPQAAALKRELAAALNVPAGMELLLGNGSDELIQIIALALARPGAVVLAPTPTFVMYELISIACGLRFVGVPLRDDFALDVASMRAAIERERPAVIFLAYPNNPTGNLFDADAVRAIIAQAPGLVVIDEAYHAFAGASFVNELGAHDNFLLLRTLSKQGLAGLRLGVLAGAPAWLAEFDKVRLPYNLGTLAQRTGLFALEHLDAMAKQAAQIREERERLYQALSGMPGIRAWPSRANFILFRLQQGKVSDVFQALRAAGVLIKNLDGAREALAACLRVTVGTPEENDAFLKALARALKA